MKKLLLVLIIIGLSFINSISQQNTYWKVVNYEPPTITRYATIPKGKIVDISFVDQNIGYAVIYNGCLELYKTENKGVEWSKCEDIEDTDLHPWAVKFSAGNGLIMCKGDKNYYTNNNGETWKPMEYSDGLSCDFPKIYYNSDTFFVSSQKNLFRSYDNCKKLDPVIFYCPQPPAIVPPQTPTTVVKIGGRPVTAVIVPDHGPIARAKIIAMTFGNDIGVVVGDSNYYYIIEKNNVYSKEMETKYSEKFRLGTAKQDMSFITASQNNRIGKLHKSTVFNVSNYRLDFSLKYTDSNFIINDVYFVNNNVGYAVGKTGEDSNYTSKIVRTLDGGETWTNVPQNFTNRLDKVYSINNQPFIIGDSILLTSFDQGLTWSVPNIAGTTSDTLRSVWCLNDTTCFAVGNRDKILFKSHDHFSKIERVCFANYGETFLNFYNTVAFKNDTLGYLFAAGVDPLKTSDGGNSWYVDNSVIAGPNFSKVTGVSFYNNYIIVGQSHGRINEWRADSNSTPQPPSLVSIFEPIASHGLTVYENSGNIRILGVFAKRKYSVSRKGNFENSYNIDSLIALPRNYSQFTNNRFLINQVFNLSNPQNNGSYLEEDFNDVKLINDTAILVSSYGIVYRSCDTGNTWIINYEAIKPLYKIHYAMPNNIYAVGDSVILNSTDGGNTWQQQYMNNGLDSIPINFKLRSVFVYGNFVYAVGVDNIILRGEIAQMSAPKCNPSEEQNIISSILLYPNPATNSITIRGLMAGNPYQIIASNGAMALKGIAMGSQIDISALPIGLYNIIINQAGNLVVYKFIKNQE